MNKQVERKYTIVNLGCANCASKMENAMNKDKRIASASINFMNSSLFVSYDASHFSNEEELYNVLNGYVNKYEHDAYLAMTAIKASQAAHHEHGDSCGCGSHEHEHSHHQEHGDSCGCGSHEHEHSHHQEHGDSCGCGSHKHEHSQEHPYEYHSSSKHDLVEKKYFIANLGCANCASKMENAMNKDPRIASASINFMKSALLVSYKSKDFSNEQQAFDVLNGYVSKFEHDAYLTTEAVTKAHTHHHEESAATLEHTLPKETHHEHEHAHGHSHEHSAGSSSEILKTVIPWVVGIGISLAGIYLADQSTLSLFLILLGYVVLGREVLENSFKNIRSGSIFDENFLMVVATAGALYVKSYTEAIAVLLLFQIGELLQGLAVDKSKRNLAEAMNLKALYATVETRTGLKQVAPEAVSVGDIIVIKPSEKVALDGIVVEGSSFIDTSSLTGESVPRKVNVNDEVLSGCINGSQTLKVRVTKPYEESTVAKVLDLVENASNRKSQTENFITKFARVYTPTVVLLAAILAIIPPIVTGKMDFSYWIYIACSFLVVSCPCALVISVPLGFFGGIGCASKNGIIVKGSNYLEGLTTLKTIVFDKTGTLTKGSFSVKEIKTISSMNKDDLLATAAMLESYSTHPIATSIVNAYKEKGISSIDVSRMKDYKEISGHGVQAKIGANTYSLGNKRFMDSLGATNAPDSIDTIGTIAYLAKESECMGYIIIADEVKEDSKETIAALKRAGIKTVLLTGDTKTVAEKVASNLGIDAVYAELLPTDKVTKLEELMSLQPENESTAFVGDGINDAPVIARSDIGMAMGGVGSDAAIEAADIVLMTDEPSKIAKAIAIGRHTKSIVTANIIFALGTKIAVLLLLAFGFGTMWLAIFADVGVSLLAIFNSIRALNMKGSL